MIAKKYGGVPKWLKGADCKSVGSAFGGSNPPSSTRKTVDRKSTVFCWKFCGTTICNFKFWNSKRVVFMGAFFDFLEVIEKELIVFFTATLPLVELKGAIPVGMGMGLSTTGSFVAAYLGSLLPVPILLFFLKPIMAFLKKTRLLAPFANWIERRTHKKGQGVRKYSLLGLFIFVAVPLPTTGVWTGSAIASFLDIRVMHAFPTIALGNLVAGLIIMFLTHQFF